MRLSSSQRQGQIVGAALDLLAEHSVDRVTTRRVAARVGISQPALFRHFASRDDILIAVLDHVRESLGSEARCILAANQPARQAVTELVTALLGYVARHPGMPRLLFYDAATSVDEAADSTLRPRLRQLLDMQRALLCELLTRARSEGQIPVGVDPAEAARLLLTLIQGRILAWHLGRESQEPQEGLNPLLDFYWAGLEAWGQPVAEAPAGVQSEVLLHFDVRKDLDQGLDPLASIRSHLARLRPQGLLVLEAPFLPEPLLILLQAEGWTCEVEGEDDQNLICILGPEADPILDLRELEPPEPMVQILEKSAQLDPDQVLLARLPRVPRMLLPRLAERGLAPQWIETREGSVYLALQAARPESQE